MAAAWIVGVLGASLGLAPPEAIQTALALAVLAMGLGAVAAGLGLGPRPAMPLARARRLATLCSVPALVAGWASARPPKPPELPPPGLARLEATAVTSDHGRFGPSTVLRVERGARVSDGAPLPPGALLRLRDQAFAPGTRLSALVRVTPRVGFRNPTPHPPWPRYRAIAGTARLPPGAVAEELTRPRARRWVEALRARVRDAFDRTLDERTAGLARALALGERGAVRTSDQKAVREAGLAHVLAVSGLHVALVAGLLVAGLFGILRRVPAVAARWDVRRWSAAAGIPLSFGFALFAGGAPSAVRAAVTASLGWALVAFGRRPDARAVTAAAALGLGAASPAEVVRPAFLLSVSAVAAIVTAPRGEPAWKAAFQISVRSTIATAPLVWWCFGSVPVVGVVANVVLVPVAGALLVPLTLVHGAVALVSADVAPMTGALLAAVARAFLAASDAFSEVTLGQKLPPPTVLQGLALAAAAAGLLFLPRRRPRLVALALAAATAVAAEAHLRAVEQPEGAVRITAVDVGQGDASLIDLPDGQALLVDAGGASFGGSDPGRFALAPLLRARRRHGLALVALTHLHPDHYGGLPALLETIDIGEVWLPGQVEAESPDTPAGAFSQSLRERGIPLRTPRNLCGAARSFGEARLSLLWPCPGFDPGYGLNDNSLVLRLDFRSRSALFAGDIEAPAETAIVRNELPLAAEVLKTPHHGSKTSSTPRFLAAVDPTLALVSAGRRNRFGHPHHEALTRLRRGGATVLRTDRLGGIILRTDGGPWSVRSWRDEGLDGFR
jgi:competence protein ComEC